MALPTSRLPPSLAARALPLLLSQLAKHLQAPPSKAYLPQLALALQLLAQDELAALPSPSTTSDNDLVPLYLLLHLAPSISLDWDAVVSAIIAYTSYSGSLRTVLDLMLALNDSEERIRKACEETIDDLLRPTDRAPNQVARILLALARAHPFISSLLLSHSDFLPTLHRLYADLSPSSTDLSVQAKADLLLMFSVIMGTGQAHVGKLRKKKALEELRSKVQEDSNAEALLDASFWQDYLVFFASSVVEVEGDGIFDGNTLTVGFKQLETLRDLRARSKGEDPRLAVLQSLFPTIPLSLFRTALSHPKFALTKVPSTASPETLAAPLIEAILSGGSDLPTELAELRKAAAHSVGGPVSPVQRKRPLRENAFDDDLDLSKLRLKGVEDDFIGNGLPKLKADIPDHLRASILRLAQSQVIEEEEEARALRDASYGNMGVAGPSTERVRVRRSRTKPFEENDHRDLDDDDSDDDDDGRRRIKIRGGGDGDASDQDAEGGVASDDGSDDGAPVNKLPREAARPSQAALQQQMTLELAYLRDHSVFDRDSETRRSRARAQLREASGMDDGQLEGWRIMLERNPHKDAILSKHQWDPRMIRPHLVAQERAMHDDDDSRDRPPHLERGGGNRGSTGGRNDLGGRGRGRGGSGGGSSEGSGRGGGDGGRGGRGGRGGAGGENRGRGQNKGSRGHSNAARSRGHDRKMAKMGSGL